MGGWSYYAMVFNVLRYYFLPLSLPIFIVLIIIYHVILILFIWSWVKTVFTQPWTADSRYQLTSEEADNYYKISTQEQRSAYLLNIVESRGLRVCQRQDLRTSSYSRYRRANETPVSNDIRL